MSGRTGWKVSQRLCWELHLAFLRLVSWSCPCWRLQETRSPLYMTNLHVRFYPWNGVSEVCLCYLQLLCSNYFKNVFATRFLVYCDIFWPVGLGLLWWYHLSAWPGYFSTSCFSGCYGREEDSSESTQQVYSLSGLCVWNQNWPLSGDDHHEWRRPKVNRGSLSHVGAGTGRARVVECWSLGLRGPPSYLQSTRWHLMFPHRNPLLFCLLIVDA